MVKDKKKWKNKSIVIVNSKAKMTRPITLEVLVQEQKLELKRGRKFRIQNWLRGRTQILPIEMHVHYAINLFKQEQNVGYAVDGFIINVKELQSKECLKNTRMKHTISVKNDKEQKQLEVAITDIRKQLQE